jgi:hypothetical protein
MLFRPSGGGIAGWNQNRVKINISLSVRPDQDAFMGPARMPYRANKRLYDGVASSAALFVRVLGPRASGHAGNGPLGEACTKKRPGEKGWMRCPKKCLVTRAAKRKLT